MRRRERRDLLSRLVTYLGLRIRLHQKISQIWILWVLTQHIAFLLKSAWVRLSVTCS